MATKEKNNLLPVYALVGSDKLKIKLILSRLNERLEEYSDPAFNTSIFQGTDTSADEIVQACMQMPFNGTKRLVIVHDANKLKKNDTETIIKYLDSPNESCILTLVYNKLAKNTHMYKACLAINKLSILDCSAPKNYLVAESLNSIARTHGGSINLDAAKLLVDLIGYDTLKLNAEIQKLIILSPDKNIDSKLVKDNVAYSNEIKPWDFTNAFAARDINKCLDYFNKMDDGVEYMLLVQCCKIIKELICVKDLGKHANQNDVARELNYDSWRVKNHIRWANAFTKEELVDILEKALLCDKKMKSTSNSALAFETFIIDSLSK